VAVNSQRNPWAVLASTIISLRTKDDVTAAASDRLLAQAGDAASLLKLNQAAIEKLIYPAGFYHTKALNLLKTAKILVEQYGGKVPDTQEALMALPGVGLKTANLVLSEGFGREDAICVDTHVHRISNRNGWVSTKTPNETEAALRAILPMQYRRRINTILVRYGQLLCRPQSPWCSKCVISWQCAKHGVDRQR
jgi:endonuclease-3